ncbi:hypothetical protein K3495_g12842 [Podosphaera aphanis]|nr:hypothetical protein K3495_g12842 [Podosphaera aphanis]
MARFATNVTVCLDNQESALRLKSNAPIPSSSELKIRWCPAHVSILGNETADSLAKLACEAPGPTLAKLACEAPGPTLAPSIARAKRETKARYEASVATYWSRNAPDR